MRRRSKFRPCIDLHQGKVKQVVGGTFDSEGDVEVNHTSEHPPSYFATLYKKDQLKGGHVIQLGPGNAEAAKEALQAWPGHLQIGGGINSDNAEQWINHGASHVIVTSYLFDEQYQFQEKKLHQLLEKIDTCQLVIDLSCRSDGKGSWYVAMDRWRQQTDLLLTPETLEKLAPHCHEYLIHAADVEGKCQGIDQELATFLGNYSPIPVVYAGGAQSIDDLQLIDHITDGKVDITIGSALDIFGGTQIKYEDCVAFNHR